MQFKAKLRKIGNSQGIYIPKEVITSYNIGDTIDVEVITSPKETNNVITSPPKKKAKLKWCTKHDVWDTTCKCK